MRKKADYVAAGILFVGGLAVAIGLQGLPPVMEEGRFAIGWAAIVVTLIGVGTTLWTLHCFWARRRFLLASHAYESFTR